MSRHYYYFAATLPMIRFDSKHFPEMEDFLEDARRLMSSDDYALVEDVVQGGDEHLPATNATYHRLKAFLHNFRNEIAFQRAQKAGKDPSEHVRGPRDVQPDIAEAYQQAAKTSDLLKAETILDKLRWSILDEFEVQHFYNLDYILIYAVKLSILSRYDLINSAKGKDVFKELKKVEIPV